MMLSSPVSSSHITVAGSDAQPPEEGENKCLNSELWHACAGPLVSLPQIGSRVVYFPQGHSEQVAVSTNKEINATIPNYPGLPPQLVCQLHNVTIHADVETDEVYAQMTLQPLSPQEQKNICLQPAELGTLSKQPTNYFCKTLTASDTSTHGGFSVPRRAAEKVFPPLDYTQSPPCQELVAKDLHGNEWKFRHIFRGQPKRHLLTTGWSVFVSAKRLVAGDSVIFIWNENNQLFLGIRHANRSQTVMPSSVLSSDSMHIGLLAAAAHAAATNSRFTIFYNPRASPSEFVIPLGKYVKSVYHTRVSVGMRFRMLFETEESSVRRYMGTITGISDFDPVRWPNSHWRSVKVGWDESTTGERQPRVSLWEIEPLTTFPIYPSPFSLRLKRPWPHGLPSFPGGDLNLNSPLAWLRGGISGNQGIQFLNCGTSPLLQPRLDHSMLGLQPHIYQGMALNAMGSLEPSKLTNQSLLQFQQNIPNVSDSLLQNHMLHQSHPQNNFLQNFSENSVSQAQILQQQLQQFQDQKTEIAISTGPPLGSAYPSNFMPLQSNQLQNFSGLIGNNNMPSSNNSSMQSLLSSFSLNGQGSYLVNSHDPNSPVSSSKRVALDPQLSSNVSDFGIPHPEEVSDLSALLPPFPNIEFSDFQHVSDSHNNSLSGVNMQFPHTLDMTRSSCLNESGYLQSSQNLDQTNSIPKTSVKVHKSGSLIQSLDITKFSSYYELRSELARMFEFEGLLEDPQRSGWQLVFIDRENDVLLLGDDPWQEFVNNVWYIKILSPLEVQQMSKEGLNLPNSIHNRSHSYGNHMNRDDSRNNINGTLFVPVGSLDY